MSGKYDANKRFNILRDMVTGAVILYATRNNYYVVIPGNPLCDERQYAQTVTKFLQWL